MEAHTIQVIIAIVSTLAAVFVVVRNVIGKEERAFVVNASGKKVEFNLINDQWEIVHQEKEEQAQVSQPLEAIQKEFLVKPVSGAGPTNMMYGGVTSPDIDPAKNPDVIFKFLDFPGGIDPITMGYTSDYLMIPGMSSGTSMYTCTPWSMSHLGRTAKIAYAIHMLKTAGLNVTETDKGIIYSEKR
jgi:hypothetical protein